ncbi:MAG: sigma 54-interacting transcriptional regulator, partial [Pseudomonadota bacterium]
VARERKPQIVNSTEEDERWYKGIDEKTKFTTKSLLCVPLLVGDKTVGVIEVINKCDGTNFGEDDQEILLKVASLAATVLENASRYHKLKDQYARLKLEVAGRYDIIGSSQAISEVMNLAQRVAAGNTTVLLQGENGTGKELLARYIHGQSPRKDGAFIAVNCAAIPLDLLESELFGYEKGAFTGAASRRKGHFEAAHNGTIFLDEVGDLSPATQVKLLRVIQEREFERVGGTATIKTDVRVIAATNRSLEELIDSSQFRQDLYYRLNVFPIHVPPLRERGTDILLLANHFAERFSKDNHKAIRRISTPAIDMLMSYHWPGNVRELENCIERAVLLSTDEVIHGHHLPPTLQTAEFSGTVHRGTLDSTLENVERELIVEALKNARGNKAKAARSLGISERLMGLRVVKYGIDPRRFRTRS